MKINDPWLSLWIKPRSTFKKLVEVNPYWAIVPLAIFNGILGALTWLVLFWKQFPQERGEFTPFFFVSSIFFGIVISLIVLYLGSLLLMWTGRWIGGKGDYIGVKCAVGWSNYPFIVSGIFGLIAALLLWRTYAPLPFDIIKSIIFIWGIVILVKMTAEAHRFSSWKGLLALVIAVAIATAVVLGLVFGIGALISLFVH